MIIDHTFEDETAKVSMRALRRAGTNQDEVEVQVLVSGVVIGAVYFRTPMDAFLMEGTASRHVHRFKEKASRMALLYMASEE